MAFISKHLFDQKISNISCNNIIHKWNENCIKSWYTFEIECLGGIAGFLFIMYMAQHLIMRTELTEKNIKQLIKDYIRSVLFGSAFSFSFITFNCIQFKLIHKLNYYITTYGTGMIMGSTSILSPKSRINVEATYFSIMALECFLRHLIFRGLLPRNEIYGTPYFILSNSLMMYLLWNKVNKDKTLQINWLFKPYNTKNENSNKLCQHPGTCFEDCIKVSRKYLLISLGITVTKIIIKLLKERRKNMFSLLKISYLREPLFIWAYVALHKAVHCSLTAWRGEDNSTHSIIAALISSLSYLIKPNLTIPASQTILITMALFDKLREKFEVPKFPYPFLCFTMSTSILLHFAIVNKKLVPNYFITMLSKGSAGKSDQIFQDIQYLATSIT